MNKSKVNSVFEKMFREVHVQDRIVKENYQDISRRMLEMKRDMKKKEENSLGSFEVNSNW